MTTPARRRTLLAIVASDSTFLLLAALASCAYPGGLPRAWTPAERESAAQLTEASLLAHIRMLADDVMEGRAPGSRGSTLAMRYIASQMERIGLRPGAANGTWYQPVELVGLKSTLTTPATLRLQSGGEEVVLATPSDAVVSSGRQGAARDVPIQVQVQDAEVVFVGYGITAPEERWDDYKGVDVRGKILLMLNNDPADDPALFGGKTRLYYGRWTYKYEEAARRGARGAIIVHTTASAGYGWQVVQTSFGDEEFELPQKAGEPRLDVKLWLSERATAALVKQAGLELPALLLRAERRDFRPVPLGVTLSVGLRSATRRVLTANVLGVLRGSDPTLASEAVVYGAHHDHLGMRAARKGDNIYNGAIDNASGVGGMLALAEALARGSRPARSVLFAAFAAEESGLLGSERYCQTPTFAPGRIAANLNIDGLNVWGRTRDVIFIGKDKSSLHTVLAEVAKEQDRVVKPDQSPEKGYFYRSDQFNFARIGVPSVYYVRGGEFLGPGAKEAREHADAYESRHYHQPSDEVHPEWNLAGAVDDLRLLLVAGLRIASEPSLPSWRTGDEFEAVRKRAVAGTAPAQPAASGPR